MKPKASGAGSKRGRGKRRNETHDQIKNSRLPIYPDFRIIIPRIFSERRNSYMPASVPSTRTSSVPKKASVSFNLELLRSTVDCYSHLAITLRLTHRRLVPFRCTWMCNVLRLIGGSHSRGTALRVDVLARPSAEKRTGRALAGRLKWSQLVVHS